MAKSALVSIGLPVYNGETDLPGALDSLLAQTYLNFELIVSDNASTDRTWAICQEYATRDKRIRLYRNEENRGASYNFGRVFELATGEYFMWAAHDDSWHPDYIHSTVEALEAQPDAALCYTDQMFIDVRNGAERIQLYKMDLRDPMAWKRAYRLLSFRPTPYAIIYGLFRREALQKGFPMSTLVAADLVMLLKVILQGAFIHVPLVLYYRKVRLKSPQARLRALLPNPRFTSPAILFIQLLLALWKIALESSESLIGKLMMLWGGVRFIWDRLLFETFIRPIRNLKK